MTPQVMRLQEIDDISKRREVVADYVRDVFKLSKPYEQFLRHLLLNVIADDFYRAPASSSGKFHPKSSLGDGGLVRHTITVCHIAMDLLPMYELDKDAEAHDTIVCSCVLHDSFKSANAETGVWGKHSNVKAHGRIGANFIVKAAKDMGEELPLDPERVMAIAGYMVSHMSKWDESPKPYRSMKTAEAQVVAMSDYISSRKTISYDLGD